MSNKSGTVLETLVPFIVIGVAIALVFGLLFMFFYVFIWGVVIGGILWLMNLAKLYFFPETSTKNDSGRVIEHDDKK